MRNIKKPIEKHPIHVKSGDKVVVTSGKDKGKVSSVKKVITSENKVIVDGVNMITKAVKSLQARGLARELNLTLDTLPILSILTSELRI